MQQVELMRQAILENIDWVHPTIPFNVVPSMVLPPQVMARGRGVTGIFMFFHGYYLDHFLKFLKAQAKRERLPFLGELPTGPNFNF